MKAHPTRITRFPSAKVNTDSVAFVSPADAPVRIPGYEITGHVHDGPRAKIFRGRCELDGRKVVIKTVFGDALSQHALAHLEHEYQTLQRIESPGVIRALDFKSATSFAALILEDVGGKSLKQLLESTSILSTGTTISLALKLCAAIRDIHSAHIIHKDINPNNVIVNLNTKTVKIIDFGLSTSLPREIAATAIPKLLRGTLAYIAPEQTGRMNRAVDYRSDFYSLGATLYELFTGRPPFAGRDALELIHAHMARPPTPPHDVNPQVPGPISQIIMKLLAKNAEDRYQSIWGVEADLERCLTQWNAHGEIAPFSIDQSRMHDHFQLTQKLYGRDKEIVSLIDAFDRTSAARAEALFVTGHSGIGKTSLVREVHKPITARRGYFISGKYDQYQRNIPYSALLFALQELIRQLLSEDDASVARWQRSLQQELGANARVLSEMLPELDLIIGERTPVAALGPMENQERLMLLMRKFFAVICQPEHPLVLYLDDLQWADSASLNLLQRLLIDKDLKSFLLIASYRDNEVDVAHPVNILRAQLEAKGAATGEIALSPLAVEHVEQIVRDTLGASAMDGVGLAKLVHEKTGGNPFFVDEFLKSLHAKRLLRFDTVRRCWRCNLDRIRSQAATDNVVDLMTQNIRQLSEATQRALPLAACIGNVFDARILAVVTEQSVDATVQALEEAIRDGMLLPVDDLYGSRRHSLETSSRRTSFRFAHDRVQQAAYGLIPPEQRATVHYRLGRLLLAHSGGAVRGKELLPIVDHLNIGRGEARAEERVELAKLNAMAGQEALASAVYDTALAYCNTGIELLGERGWTAHYDVALTLHHEAARAASCSNNPDELRRHFDAVRDNARTPLDKIPVYEAKVARQGMSAVVAALETGIEALQLLNVRLPPRPGRLTLLYYRLRTALVLWWRGPEKLLDRAPMTDPVHLTELRIIERMLHPSYWFNLKLNFALAYRAVYLCARFGYTPSTPHFYTFYAMTLCSRGSIEKGYRFGEIALKLLKKHDTGKHYAGALLMICVMTKHWKEPSRLAIAPLLEAYRRSLETGDLETAVNGLIDVAYNYFHSGEPLPSLYGTLQTYMEILEKPLQSARGRSVVEVYRDATAYLMEADHPKGLFAHFSDPEETEARARDAKPFTFNFFGGFLAIHFADAERAYAYMRECVAHAHTAAGILRFVDMYYGLALVMIHPTLGGHEQKRNAAAIRATRKRLRRFATHGPANYLHRSLLLEAECARLDKKYGTAEKHFDEAIKAAKESGHVHEEALALELAGRHYAAQGRELIAQAYIAAAHALYERWGATRKVRWLEQRYPQFRLSSGERRINTLTSHDNQTALPLDLDLPALMKALKAIAEEKVHSQILHKTIDIVMQFAGAEKALLLLRDSKDMLLIEADMDTYHTEAQLLKSIPLEASQRLCQAVVNYVRHAKKSIVIHDAGEPQSAIPGLQNDAYIRDGGVKSILCMPIMTGIDREAELIGVLYAENNQSGYAFSDRRVEILEIICLSVAGRLELSRKATMDSLTNLYNRDYFENSLAKEFSLAQRTQRPLSLLMIDIDHFKKINDQWGHQAGDGVLKYVSQMLKSSCRDSDIVARYGGEEMAIILAEASSEQALDVAERIRLSLEKRPCELNGEQIHVTASIGVATNDLRRDSPASLIKAADEALYRSKAEGRNRTTVL